MGYGAQYSRYTAIQTITTGAVGVLFYALRIVLYGGLSPEDYGLFYAAFSFCMAAHPFLSLGFDPGLAPFVTRFKEENDSHSLRSATWSVVLAQAMVGAMVIAGGLAFRFLAPAGWLGGKGLASLVLVLTVYVAVTLGYKTWFNVLLGLRGVGVRNLAEFVRAGACLGLAYVWLGRGWGVLGAAAAYAVASALAALIEFVAAAWQEPELIEARPSWRGDLVRAVFVQGVPATAAFGGITLFANLDTVMLTALRGDLRAVAAYQLALPTVAILNSLLMAAAANFMPMATLLEKRGEQARLIEGLARIYAAAFALVLPIAIVLGCYARELMEALFRRDVLDAPDAFWILAVGAVPFFLCFLNLHVLTGMGRTREACRSVIVGLGANLVLNFVLIPCWGIRGAAFATALSYVIAAALGARALKANLGLRTPWRPMMASMIGGIALAFILGSVRRYAGGWAFSCIVTLVAMALFVAYMEVLGDARLRLFARTLLGGQRRPRASRQD